MSTSIRCWYRQWSQLTIVGFVQNHFTGSSDILGPIQTLICTKRIPLKKISPHYHYQDALLIEFVLITVIKVWSNQTPSTPFELGSLWMTSLWTDVNWLPSNYIEKQIPMGSVGPTKLATRVEGSELHLYWLNNILRPSAIIGDLDHWSDGWGPPDFGE